MIPRILSALALGLTLSACSTSRPVTLDTQSEGASSSEMISRGSAPDSERLEAIFRARQDSARSRFVQADVDFMTGMIGHHAQALIMSRLAPENGAGSRVATLASRIINAQNDEIATMQKWLSDREQPVPEVHIDGLNLMLHGVEHHHAHMPGMLTEEQLKELAAAQGVTFDRLYLKYMIQHHSGAVTMVDEWFATDGVGQDEAAFKLASDINVDQKTEIARMQLMLDAIEATNVGN